MGIGEELDDIDRGDAVERRRHLPTRRVFWHAVGLVLALVLAWLVLRAYRQPEFLLELSNLRLC